MQKHEKALAPAFPTNIWAEYGTAKPPLIRTPNPRIQTQNLHPPEFREIPPPKNLPKSRKLAIPERGPKSQPHLRTTKPEGNTQPTNQPTNQRKEQAKKKTEGAEGEEEGRGVPWPP